MYKVEGQPFTENLFLIDTAWALHKNYHAIPLTCKINGVETRTGHLFGTLRLIQSIYSIDSEATVILCLDSYPDDKQESLEGYKAGRTKTFDLEETMKDLSSIATVLPRVYAAVKKGVEADELLFSLSRSWPSKRVYIYSGDNDLLQAITDKVRVVRKINKQGIVQVEEAYVRKTFGVESANILAYRVLAGDKSDNIPPVSGVRPKIARQLAVEVAHPREYLEMQCFSEEQKGEILRNVSLMELKDMEPTLWKSELKDANRVVKKYKLFSFFSFIRIVLGEEPAGKVRRF